MKEIRLLKENEIEVRVGSISEKGATLLLYKDARVDMNMLDETYGIDGWQRKHYELKGHIYCSVGIKFGDNWVWKDDVGTESVSEATKGESSDSFKRACFNWGIGRELYSAPFTWIAATNYKGYTNSKGKPATYDKFRVVSIGYDENKEINALVIKNDTQSRIVFTLGKTVAPEEAIDVNTGLLAKAKVKINEKLEEQNYTRSDSKKAFIKGVLKKETIDDLDEVDLIMDALENEE